MAYGNWDDIVQEYHQTIRNGARELYIRNAHAILRIIPAVREHFKDSEVIPLTSLTNLVLELPYHPIQIRIYSEDQETYHVYLYHKVESKDSDERVVTLEELIPTIEEHLHTLGTSEPKAI